MSFYRSLLAAVAAMVIATPVFAQDAAAQATAADASKAKATATAPATQTKVNINKASAKELMAVAGITSSRANAIVKYRKQNGDFKSVDDLASVRGFKKMKAEKLKTITDQLSIE